MGDEYLANKSMSPSKHKKGLDTSTGLLELHYDTMRRAQLARKTTPSFIHSPTMDRPFAATTGYSGFIPGKISSNVVGCTFKNGSTMAYETRGQHYPPTMSGVTFSLGSTFNKSRSCSSLPALG